MRAATRSKDRGSSQGGGGVSLFPFLAVLICTMGSLIVVLIVLARQARMQAADDAHTAAAKTSDDLEQIKAEREVVSWQASAMADSRTATDAQLAEARLRLGSVEDHIRGLHEQLARLESAAQELARVRSGETLRHCDMEAELARLKGEIAAAEQLLADEQEAAQQRGNSYAIIPYHGSNQTHRRPIYIECRSDAIILQPEGIVLGEDDFAGPMGPGNPLAAALRAGREYLVSVHGTQAGQADEPYPLMLVRPDGIAAYYAARGAMDSWGSEFGYELIGQDWNLDFPPPDPGLARVVRQAVAVARKRQELLARIAPRPSAAKSRPVYRAGARGIVRENPPADDPDDLPLLARSRRPGFGTSGSGDSDAFGGSPDRNAGLSQRPTGTNPYGTPGDANPYGDPGQNGTNGHLGESGPYASTPSDRTFGSHFETGDGAGGDAGAAGSRRGAAAGGDHAAGAGAPPPEDYLVGRPGEGDPSAVAGGQPLRPGQWQPSPESPSPTGPSAASCPQRPEQQSRSQSNLAKTRGTDWGLPGTARGAISITRPIHVDCHANHVVIAPGARLGSQTVQLAPRTVESVDSLISAVWDHMDTWGIAGRGLYWRPVLTVRVDPAAEARYADLKVLLEGSGLKLERLEDQRSAQRAGTTSRGNH